MPSSYTPQIAVPSILLKAALQTPTSPPQTFFHHAQSSTSRSCNTRPTCVRTLIHARHTEPPACTRRATLPSACGQPAFRPEPAWPAAGNGAAGHLPSGLATCCDSVGRVKPAFVHVWAGCARLRSTRAARGAAQCRNCSCKLASHCFAPLHIASHRFAPPEHRNPHLLTAHPALLRTSPCRTADRSVAVASLRDLFGRCSAAQLDAPHRTASHACKRRAGRIQTRWTQTLKACAASSAAHCSRH